MDTARLPVHPVGTLRFATQEGLTAENNSLRVLIERAGIDAKALLAQAGIDANEREAADKLQKLILEELHHRIKNTLATVSSIAAQSLRTATSVGNCGTLPLRNRPMITMCTRSSVRPNE
jgi:hypothetical protein